jgi:hypothetical protein
MAFEQLAKACPTIRIVIDHQNRLKLCHLCGLRSGAPARAG